MQQATAHCPHCNNQETRTPQMTGQIVTCVSCQGQFQMPMAIQQPQSHSSGSRRCLSISLARDTDREEIYRLRHQVYAVELEQHSINQSESLSDDLDEFNQYLIVKRGDRLVGFISVTPQHAANFSVDKYVNREDVAILQEQPFYELRILTVVESERNGLAALLLMYGACRWLQEQQTQRVVAIGRRQVLDLYLRLGFETVGVTIKSGKVDFELMFIDKAKMDSCFVTYKRVFETLERRTDWQLDFPFSPQDECYHGGASIELLGSQFDHLDTQPNVINADVLDAWFPPCPEALRKLKNHLGWLSRTSPPTQPRNLESEIARQRNVPSASVVAGAGSTDLIYRAFQQWLDANSKVLLITPCYGEYEFILRQVLHCKIETLNLKRGENFRLSLRAYEEIIGNGYDMVVVVNPNNPTGAFLDQRDWQDLLKCTPSETRIWIDECYIDYVDGSQSLELLAASGSNITVCKSLSKTLGLSGLRVGYLCLSPSSAREIRKVTPPWIVGTLGQIAAMEALRDSAYYEEQYRRTHQQRRWLENEIGNLGFEVLPGCANFFVAWLAREIPSTSEFLKACEDRNLFLRDIYPTSPSLGRRAVRFAVKDQSANQRMVETIKQVMRFWKVRDSR